MAGLYRTVQWNRQKRRYDLFMLLGIGLFLVSFVVFNFIFQPEISPETLIIRASGLTAFILLHIILCIGPLARLDERFMPWLYNRRHMGVTMAVFALIHGLFSLIQFHGLGNVQPLISLFTSNTHYGSVMRFPFQPLGFFALIIILLMASTSHDFWLKNLGPRFWKTLHMLVYLAYGLLLMHVMLGVVQLEQSAAWILLPGLGMILIVSLHAVAGLRTFSATVVFPFSSSFMEVCSLDDIPEKRAKMVLIGAENIAIFRYDGKLSAVSNVCKHQNGPLGEGRIVDSCIVCPWHGYEYRPEDGCSPPPFTERIATYELRLEGRKIWVDPRPRPEGSRVDPILIPSE